MKKKRLRKEDSLSNIMQLEHKAICKRWSGTCGKGEIIDGFKSQSKIFRLYPGINEEPHGQIYLKTALW